MLAVHDPLKQHGFHRVGFHIGLVGLVDWAMTVKFTNAFGVHVTVQCIKEQEEGKPLTN
jgi:hypothetical protein